MERITRFLLGPLFVLGGLWVIAMPFAFATMRFGGDDAPPGWAEYLGEVLRGGTAAIVIGLALTGWGLYLASTWISSSDREGRT